jgi:1,4-alpha-glucan branching enzyme
LRKVEIISSPQGSGYLLLVLHAHLPYIRNPDHEYFLEERWLFEAVTETYIPLLHLFEQLLNDRIDFRITVSLTPTLIEMFNDSLLMERCQRYIDNLIELSGKEVARTRRDGSFGPVARMYRRRLLKTRRLFEEVYRKDLTSAFRSLLSSGKIDIITSCATHAYLPALVSEPRAAMAQVAIGAGHFRKNFGRAPTGIWLPECGFYPGCDALLKKCGIRFFFLESHGLLDSTPQNSKGIYRPLRTPAGVFAFSRDAECSRQVWSSTSGYPGDFDYRDFYRDIGFDLDFGYLRPHLPEGIRTFTGLKYYRITGNSNVKHPYLRQRALRKAKIHARHFLRSRTDQILSLGEKLKIKPVVTAAYDAELFGHWWFEGPEWLSAFLKMASKQQTFRLVTPAEYLSENGDMETAMPSMSSWGDRGYSTTWVNSSNAWIYKHLTRAARMMGDMASRQRAAEGLMRRALNQAARELLLAEASDWAFMMKTGSATEFAKTQVTGHVRNFFELHRNITRGRINEETVLRLERTDNIFADIDYRIYAGNWSDQIRSLSKG